MFGNCTLQVKDLHVGTLSAAFATKQVASYYIDFKLMVVNEEIERNAVIAEFFGSRTAVAEFLHKLGGSLPDMTVYVIAVEHFAEFRFKLMLSIVSLNDVVLPPAETLRILDNFVAKKSKTFNLADYHSYVSVCDNSTCGKDCQQIKLIDVKHETLRFAEKLWHVPFAVFESECANTSSNYTENLCGNSKCYQ